MKLLIFGLTIGLTAIALADPSDVDQALNSPALANYVKAVLENEENLADQALFERKGVRGGGGRPRPPRPGPKPPGPKPPGSNRDKRPWPGTVIVNLPQIPSAPQYPQYPPQYPQYPQYPPQYPQYPPQYPQYPPQYPQYPDQYPGQYPPQPGYPQ